MMDKEKIIETIKETISVVPQAYDDVISPTVKPLGQIISYPIRIVRAKLQPLEKWLINQESTYEKTDELIAEELQSVCEEKIVTPEPYVYIPAIQALSYSIDCDELCSLYAKLLAKSMNADTISTVHPSYVEILKQLSPFDAKLLAEELCHKEEIHNAEIRRIYNGDGSYDLVERIYCQFSEKYGRQIVSLSISNLARLSIVEIFDNRQLDDPEGYESLLDGSTFKVFAAQNDESQTFKLAYGALRVTEFGKTFIETCVKSFSKADI